MLLLLILCVCSAPVHGFFENCAIAAEYCCNCTEVDDGHREAERGYDKNLTSRMDAEEGCRWLFKSETTECCYAAKERQCRYYNHDDKKCRKNHTGFIVYPEYSYTKCTLQLFDIDYKDQGEYRQTTETFDFTIKLSVTRNTYWDAPVISVFSTSAIVFIVAVVIWRLRKWWTEKELVENQRIQSC